jgi:hypothetical protein
MEVDRNDFSDTSDGEAEFKLRKGLMGFMNIPRNEESKRESTRKALQRWCKNPGEQKFPLKKIWNRLCHVTGSFDWSSQQQWECLWGVVVRVAEERTDSDTILRLRRFNDQIHDNMLTYGWSWGEASSFIRASFRGLATGAMKGELGSNSTEVLLKMLVGRKTQKGKTATSTTATPGWISKPIKGKGKQKKNKSPHEQGAFCRFWNPLRPENCYGGKDCPFGPHARRRAGHLHSVRQRHQAQGLRRDDVRQAHEAVRARGRGRSPSGMAGPRPRRTRRTRPSRRPGYRTRSHRYETS